MHLLTLPPITTRKRTDSMLNSSPSPEAVFRAQSAAWYYRRAAWEQLERWLAEGTSYWLAENEDAKRSLERLDRPAVD